MKPERLNRLPEDFRRSLVAARRERGWSQRELGERVGLPQAHISAIETGKVAPRFDTLLDLVRLLGHDLVLVPRPLVPAVKAMVRDFSSDGRAARDQDPEALYAVSEGAEEDRDGD